MFSCAMFWSSHRLLVDSKPCDYLCLLSLHCIMLILYSQNCAVWDFSLVMCLVIVSWLVLYGATMKPRASYGPRPQGCAARHALVSWFLVTIHCRTTPTCYSHMNFSLIASPYVIVRSISQTKSHRASIWRCIKDNLWRRGHRHKHE
jgi:hypothetical protein